MKSSLMFIIPLACSLAVQAQTSDTTAVHAASLPKTGGYLLQTTGPQGQTLRWYNSSVAGHPPVMYSQLPGQTRRWVVELAQPSVADSLQQIATEQNELKTVEGGAQLTQANISALLQQPLLVGGIQLQVQNEQQSIMQQIKQLAPLSGVKQTFQLLSNSLIIEASATDIPQLRSIPGVSRVYEETTYHVTLSQSVPLIGAPAVWLRKDASQRTIRGQKMRVAILDTGVDYTHSALGGCFGSGCKVIGGYDFVDNDADPMDVHGHGTHVASIAAGADSEIRGVAPDASIYAYKVLNDQGSGTDSSILAALERALDPDQNPATDDQPHVINLSIGGSGDQHSVLSQAVDRVVRAGIVVVAAAGNAVNFESITAPGSAELAITVANTTKDDLLDISSSRGPLTEAAFIKPELTAPGTDIRAAQPGNRYVSLTGTSMSAPHVSGAVALLLQSEPELTPLQVKQRLMQTAKPLAHGTDVFSHGAGRLNIDRAVHQQITADTTAIYLGNAGLQANTLSGRKSFTITNRSVQKLTVDLSVLQSIQGLTLSFDSPQIEFKAQESKQVFFNYQMTLDRSKASVLKPGGWSQLISATSTAGTLQIPVYVEDVAFLNLNTDGYSDICFLFDKDWEYTQWRRLRLGQTDFRLRINHPQIQLICSTDPYQSDLDVGTNSEEQPVVRYGYLIKPNISVPATSSLQFSTDQLKYRLRTTALTQNGQAIDFNRLGLAGDLVVFNMPNGSFFNEFRSFAVPCKGTCFSLPTEVFINDVPDAISLEVLSLYVGDSAAGEPEIVHHIAKHADISSHQEKATDLTAADVLPFSVMLPVNQTAKLWAGQTIGMVSAKTYTGTTKGSFYYPVSTEVPYLRPSFGFYRSTLHSPLPFQSFGSSGIFSRVNGNKLAKWPDFYHLDRQTLPDYQSSVLAFPMTSQFRHWSARPYLSSQELVLSRYVKGDRPVHTRDLAVVRDLFQNSVLIDDGLTYRLNCLTSKVMTPDWQADQVVLRVHHQGCKDIEFSYVLATGETATAQYLLDSTNSYVPALADVHLYNNNLQSDYISKINHRLEFYADANGGQFQQILLSIRKPGGEWRDVYTSTLAGLHRTNLPYSLAAEFYDVRFSLKLTNGNTLVNTIPKALEIGSATRGENDADADTVPDAIDPDDDNDGTPDVHDAFPLDPKETTDTDKDGIGNNADPDDDNDGTPDVHDAFPLDPKETTDTDKDGIGNNADPDDDNDGTPDVNDAFPLDPKESIDTDKDGIGNNADPDDDNDGTPDVSDAFPLDPKETLDTDKDGIGNNADPDDDNDGTPDVNDAFPLDPKETTDTDKDGIGNNADPDDDNDGTPDVNDAFPLDPKETLDTDKDGIGNNADPDDDNDGTPDVNDAFPLDPKETLDTDKDGIGNNADPDDDNDGTPDVNDAFPLDPKETLDTDKDGIGNNADTDDDNDGTPDVSDAFPLDAKEILDTDKDGIGNNTDPDDDNDGVPDGSDQYPLDASRSNDPAPKADTSGGGGAGLGMLLMLLPILRWQRRSRFWGNSRMNSPYQE